MEALAKNAKGVLIEEGKISDSHWDGFRSRAVVAVKDSLRALGDIARARRKKWGPSVVAVTESLIPLTLAGGEVLHDFSLALLGGVIFGTYSSVFVASPLVLLWPGKAGRILKRS